jgi:electron transfer flavoprotein alpha subunit
MSNVLAIGEQRGGEIRRVSREVVSAAATVAAGTVGAVHALVVGPSGTAANAASLFAYGAVTVRVAEHEGFSGNPGDVIAEHIARIVADGDYGAVVFPASSFGKDVAPRVAARLDVPLASDATALEIACNP